jgi:hypothetical protein
MRSKVPDEGSSSLRLRFHGGGESRSLRRLDERLDSDAGGKKSNREKLDPP